MPKRLITATLAAGLFVSLAAPCWAQGMDTLIFEQVGDQPIDALQIQFDQEGTLWGSNFAALWRLSPAGAWEETGSFFGQYLLVLSPDTLFLGNAGTHRSTDGGETFISVYGERGALFAADLDGPNNGVILCGAFGGGTGIAYSTDRGATFTEATFTVSTSSRPFMNTAVEIPDGPAEGRLVAGVFAGVVVSGDSGQTWEPSSLFQSARFWVQRIEIGTDPATGNRRLYATVIDAQTPGVDPLYISDDDGLTWTHVPGMPDAYLFVFVPSGNVPFSEQGGSLLAVERADAVDGERLDVWQSKDGGKSWLVVGELPADVNGGLIASDDMLIGPDGHLYVSVGRNGPEREWVYRTTEPVVPVANEPEATPAPTEGRLVVYPNPATNRITVEAGQDAEDVVLYDLLGRVVSRARLSSGKASLDVSRLPAGVYVVHVGTLTQHVTLVK